MCLPPIEAPSRREIAAPSAARGLRVGLSPRIPDTGAERRCSRRTTPPSSRQRRALRGKERCLPRQARVLQSRPWGYELGAAASASRRPEAEAGVPSDPADDVAVGVGCGHCRCRARCLANWAALVHLIPSRQSGGVVGSAAISRRWNSTASGSPSAREWARSTMPAPCRTSRTTSWSARAGRRRLPPRWPARPTQD